ncbi:trypsin-like peptidase domain-containing protein [Nonomuraea sp. NPDC055795]
MAFLPGGARLDAEIMLWDGERDVAVLRLGRNVDVAPAPLVDHASFDERVAMLGFPDGKEQGVWSVGVLRGPRRKAGSRSTSRRAAGSP